jgi:hypothetical protein
MRKRAAAAVEPLSFVEFQLPTWSRIRQRYRAGFMRSNMTVTEPRCRSRTAWLARSLAAPLTGPRNTRRSSKRLASCRWDSAIIDGEVIVMDANGRTDFAALRLAMRWEPDRLVLHLDGQDLRFTREIGNLEMAG